MAADEEEGRSEPAACCLARASLSTFTWKRHFHDMNDILPQAIGIITKSSAPAKPSR
jgi:hypothetical protein